jgi:hypothetical protein
VLEAGLRAFADVIVECQQAKLMPEGDPLSAAGPVWSLLHGVSTLTIGSDLSHVGIAEKPEALAERALRGLLLDRSRRVCGLCTEIRGNLVHSPHGRRSAGGHRRQRGEPLRNVVHGG